MSSEDKKKEREEHEKFLKEQKELDKTTEKKSNKRSGVIS